MKTAIVSGCDNKYFHKLFNLYNSLIKNNCLKNADFCVFSIDLKDEYIKKLSGTNTKIIEPGWDFKFKFQTHDWKKILTVRPFLKNYFKDYDNYIWLDADTWVQGNNFINDFANVSSLGKMSIIPEHDINYEINKNTHKYYPKNIKSYEFKDNWNVIYANKNSDEEINDILKYNKEWHLKIIESLKLIIVALTLSCLYINTWAFFNESFDVSIV